jgi:hypothetical protein
MTNLTEEDIESLKIVAQADCNSSKWAQKLLETCEGYESHDTDESRQNPTVSNTVDSKGTQEPQSTEPEKKGIFAF